MYEVIFLWLLALVYIIFAVVQDLKTKEIANWINFSLIIFALGFRFFYSIFNGLDFSFFYNGVAGLAIFFALGNLLYYGKVFAGGDAKLMISLGTILPSSANLLSNFNSFITFFLFFLCAGFLYILAASAVLCVRNFRQFKKEFARQLKKRKIIMLVLLFFGVLFSALGFIESVFLILGVMIFFTSYLYIYSKAIDEACMVKRIEAKKLREGDWLYSNVKIGKKMIKAKWEGVNKREISEIMKKYKEVRIRQGIAFSPVFLISFVAFIVLSILKIKLWNPLW